MIGEEDGSVRLGFWAVLLFSVFAWAPTTYPGYWQSLEGFLPVFNAVQPSAIAGVATAADLWRGMGSATFLVAHPLILLGTTPVVGVRVSFAIAILLGGLGMYAWLRGRWGDRAAGLAGLAYMLWPPLLATVYVRGSLSDAFVLALLPLTFAGIAILSEHRSPFAVAVVAVSLLWMWRTQPGLAVAVTILLAAYALIVERSWVAAAVVGLSAGAGFTSLLPLWSIQAAPPAAFFEHFVYPHQLFSGSWTVAPSVAGWQDQYPFQLGFATVVFGITAVWLWLTQRQEWRGSVQARLLGFSVAAALLLIFLSTPASSLLWQFSGADRLFTYPWQVMLLAGPLLAAVAGSMTVTLRDLGKPLLWTVLAGLIVLGSVPYLTTKFTQVQPPDAPVAVFGAQREIALLDAKLTENATAQEAELAITWQALQPLSFDYNVFFQALAAAPEGTEVVAQLDVQPLLGERPATTWTPGEIFTDTYRLDLSQTGLSAAAPEPGLQYHFGYYDWRDGSRLPVDAGIDDKLVFHGE